MDLEKWHGKLSEEFNKTVEAGDPSFMKAFLKTFWSELIVVVTRCWYFQVM
jgi:hypothetical protein